MNQFELQLVQKNEYMQDIKMNVLKIVPKSSILKKESNEQSISNFTKKRI